MIDVYQLSLPAKHQSCDHSKNFVEKYPRAVVFVS